VDHNFSDKSRITGRYTRRHTFAQNVMSYPGPAGAAGANTTLTNDTIHHVLSGDYVYVVKPELVNDFHFGYYHMFTVQTPPGADQDWANQLGLKNLGSATFPQVAIAGLTSLGGGNYVVRPQANNFQFSDSLTWIKGRHSIKVGGEYRALRYSNWQGNAGTFTFNTLATMNPLNRTGGVGFASLLVGVPTTTAVALAQPLPGGAIVERWKSWGLFLQDDYKVTSNLTLNLGLRWELNTPRTVDQNRQSMFNLKTLQLDYAGQNGYPETLYDYNWRGFEPRIGVAYTPFGTRTVFRAGYGIFTQPLNAVISGFEVGPWSPNNTYTSPDNGITFPVTFQTSVPPTVFNAPYVLGATTPVSWLPRTLRDPYSQQWSFNVQREMKTGMVVEAGYVGTRGTRLPLTYQLNQVPTRLLGPGNAQALRPYATRGTITASTNPVGNSTYHALQTRFERRHSGGIAWRAIYTFSKSIDDASGFATGRSYGVVPVQDNYNLRAERSVSGFDITHNIASSVSWELPVGKGRRLLNRGGWINGVAGGWTVSGISSVQSGLPLEMATVNNLTGSLDGGSRPNRLRRAALSGDQRSRLKWFDATAFSPPAAFTLGNDSRTEPGLRAPGLFNLDILMAKDFHPSESFKLQFRSEFFDAFNHFNPGMPASTIGAPGVATITTGNAGRTIQLSLKLSY
jgi:hypothetical protein